MNIDTTISPATVKSAQAPRTIHPGDKTKLSHWKRRIFKPTYQRDGLTCSSPNFAVEIQFKGKRVRWSLGAGTADVAASRARTLYLFLVSNGWEATLAKYRPTQVPNPDPTVGQFVEAVTRSADLAPKTLSNYLSSLRKITADIAGLSNTNAKFGHGKGHRNWLARVDAVRLSELSPTAIQEWKRAFLARAAQDPVSQRSARVSVNSFLRGARSLFSTRILAHIKLEMPDPLPLAGCQFEPRPSSKYRSTFDIAQLVKAATEALAPTDSEAYKVFLLASMVGLRRKEIDLLEWSAFRWDSGTIRIETTEHFSAKSEDSLGDVAIDSQVMEVFRNFVPMATSSFVIESLEQPRTVDYNFYRCQETFERLITWLRSQGVRSLKPLHTLRKEFGSQVNAVHGIHAASRALRHSAVAITDQYYTDHRTRATVGLGHLLETGKIVEFKQEVA